ncbi:alpha/beta fold hydrolase [Psychrobacter sp. 2Y5]|uniref:alpha/beta fold hydrolase n=1 Tax=unclassified Psychrobacter TaxID=196806 RepID=UPI003F47F9AB
MSIYQLKTQFQNQLRPISDKLVSSGVSANQVTVSAIVLSAGSAYVIANIPPQAGNKTLVGSDHSEQNARAWLILPLALLVRMALNAIDGMMAREHQQASTLGAVLNEGGDILSDYLLIASLSSHLPASTGKKLYLESTTLQHPKIFHPAKLSNHAHLKLINGLSTLTELIAISAHLTTGERANHGPLGKSDRALELGAIGVFMAIDKPRVNFRGYRQLNIGYIRPILWLNQLLLIKTSFNRLAFIAQHYFTYYHPPPIAKSVEAINTVRSQGRVNMPAKPIKNKTKNSPVKESTNSANLSANIIAEQSCFNAYDGTALYYRYWLTQPLVQLANQSKQQQQSEQKQVILLHRGHEHSGRLTELAERFAQSGYQVFAWDARGNGRSGGIKDHADSVTELERDLNDFIELVIAQTGIALEDTIIVASSIGAVLAAAWVHDYAPNIRGMILGTPALSIRLYIPFAIPALKVARKFGLMSRVSSYVKAQVLTHDKDAQAAYNADPLISGSISSDLLIDTHATGQRLLDDAGAITAPTFILCAGKDYVVDKQAERSFYEQLSSPNKRWQLYPDSFHAIFHETNKVDIFDDCIDFADSLFANSADEVDLSAAHINSASKDKVDRLAIKPFNPSFAITRFAMQKFGHVSDAIATGLEHGFDSGSSLDKVYANEPKGSNAFGKAVDKFYLNNIGWQGIRIRRQHLLELGRFALDQRMQTTSTNSETKNNHSTLTILDIASGNGYYVFDLLQEYEQLQAEMRDYDAHNVKVIADKAVKLGFDDRVNTLQKDAFNDASYKGYQVNDAKNSSSNRFDVAIASGVFELFSDNTLISTALEGINNSLAPNGYLLYTNQPWHPEQEFISKTLNNHRGSHWVMRCRSQAEMDQLVLQAGFKKLDMRIDRFGIFTVSLAVKVD